MEPFARTIDAAKKYVVSSTLDRVDWNAERVRGDVGQVVQQLKRESGKGLLVGGAKLALTLTWVPLGSSPALLTRSTPRNLVVNLKTAKALALTIPSSLLLRATVIE